MTRTPTLRTLFAHDGELHYVMLTPGIRPYARCQYTRMLALLQKGTLFTFTHTALLGSLDHHYELTARIDTWWHSHLMHLRADLELYLRKFLSNLFIHLKILFSEIFEQSKVCHSCRSS
eukprot:COSAG02_NODE_1412_length_12756_cov_57.891048_4_plen_119_part_00